MEYQGCKDDMLTLVRDGVNAFSPGFALVEGAIERVEQICKYIDILVPGLKLESVSASIDSLTHRLTIALVGYDMTMYNGRVNPFFDMIQLLDSFEFSKFESEYVCLKLNVDGLWEAVK